MVARKCHARFFYRFSDFFSDFFCDFFNDFFSDFFRDFLAGLSCTCTLCLTGKLKFVHMVEGRADHDDFL